MADDRQPSQINTIVPQIEAIARTIPAKQQKVSPINILEGQAFSFISATAASTNTTSKKILYDLQSLLGSLLRAKSSARQMSMLLAAMILWPTYNPLIPAYMFIVFVVYMPNSTIYKQQRQPSSNQLPKIHAKGAITPIDVLPSQTDSKGRTMKKGKRSLYLQGRSSISSAKPNRMVPKIVRNTAKCMVRCQLVEDSLRMTVKKKDSRQKETAAANPTHSGIYFYPYLLPFLLISQPQILLFFIYQDILGIKLLVIHQLATPNTPIVMAITIGNWLSAKREDNTANPVVNVNSFILHVFIDILYYINMDH